MRDALEAAQRLGDRRDRHPERRHDRDRRQRVANVVPAGHREFAGDQDIVRLPTDPDTQRLPLQPRGIGPGRRRSVAAEPDLRRPRVRRHRRCVRLIPRQDGGIASRLSRNQPSLQLDVLSPAELVEMVRRHVEQRGDPRAARRAQQLRVADLRHHRRVGVQLAQVGEQAAADVPADQRGATVGLEHLPNQRRRRGLAGAARDPDHRRRASFEEDAHRPQHRDSALRRGAQQRQVVGNPLARDDRIHALQHPELIGRIDTGRGDIDRRQLRLDHLGRPTVDDVQRRDPLLLEESRRIAALDPRTHEGDAPVAEALGRTCRLRKIHAGACNASATPRIAPAIPISQNRVTICGSDQPPSSKWLCSGAIRKTRLPPDHL